MNAVGEQFIVQAEDTQYKFSEMKVTVSNRIDEIRLMDGKLRRIRSSGYSENINLRGRIEFSQIFRYRNILKYLANGPKTLSLNGNNIYNYTLISGSITMKEGEQFAVCEITLGEVVNDENNAPLV